jgi:sec-independent protein translocase protein TatA
MFGSIGFPEMMIILIVALLVFGPKKLPEIGKSVGKAIREFKKTSEEIKDKIEQEIHADEIKSVKDDITSIVNDPYKDATENEEGKKVP